MNDAIFDDALFNAWSNNPLRTRDDVMQALRDIAAPVETYRSMGGARVRLDSAAAQFDQASADLEGFSRLLWGLAAAQVGGAQWIDWEPIAQGLANGCDPSHSEYWGDTFDNSQRLVELAAIAFGLRLVPEKLWEPLTAFQKSNVAGYLVSGHSCRHVDNNWKFFRLMVGMALRHLNIEYDRELDKSYMIEIDNFYLGDGWYQDGDTRRADHYIPFAFHFYGLILAVFDGSEWTGRYRERASLITGDIVNWFSDDGPAICFGRSLTYRFAISGFFGALALAGDQTISSGQQKGFYLRHLRWWAKQDFFARDGILPVGYAYPNLTMSEPYNSAQSPYWALKAFLPLMLPEDHPFWASEEEPAPKREKISVQPHCGFVINNKATDVVALSSGQQTNSSNFAVRFGAEKYSKFAYSARYGFSVESDSCRFQNAVLDSMIGFSHDGFHFRVRESNEQALICENGVLYARWRPYPDAYVETYLYWDGDYHIRIHEIDTARKLFTIEGGFAIPQRDDASMSAAIGRAAVTTDRDVSGIIELTSTSRQGRCHLAPPNTNLIVPKTIVPQLVAEIPAGRTVFSAAVFGHPADNHQHERTLTVCDLSELREYVRREGVPVTLMRSSAN